jgi:hypothetical protein
MEKLRPNFMTAALCGDALASRIRRFTFAESGLLFAGFLEMYMGPSSPFSVNLLDFPLPEL